MSLIGSLSLGSRHLRFAACVGGAAVLMAAAPAHAVVSACNVLSRSYSPWVVNNSAIMNRGEILATMELTIALQFTVMSVPDAYIVNGAHGPGGYDEPLRASHIPRHPGIGVRVIYGSTSTTEVTGLLPPGGAPLIDSSTEVDLGASRRALGLGDTNLARISIPRANLRYTLAQTWKYELVLLDPSVYVGGNLRGSLHLHDVGAGFQSSPASGQNPNCQLLSVAVNIFGVTVDGPPPPPVLPPVLRPTCSFSNATLRQTVGLQPVRPDEVAADGSPRSSGTPGQADFSILATNCGVGASFRIHFTDPTNAPNDSRTLGLRTTSINRNRLGIRLYHSDAKTPLNLGPVPTASNPGTNFTLISVPSGGSVSVPFTAQYVRYPTVSPAEVQAGAISADATLTIVYP